jgi:hypothetical protein
MRSRGMLLFVATVVGLFTAAPALARQERTTLWVCDVPGEGSVTFVSAAEAARHGITQADSRAGVVFETKFGEACSVK